MKPTAAATSSRLALRAQHRRRQPLQQQRGRGRVAVVNLVAHVQGLRHQRLELDGAGLGQRQIERRAQDVGHPLQAVDDLGVVGAEPQHLAEPFVEIAERRAAARRVAHDPHRHRRADDAGHRADRAVMMAGFECDGAAARRARAPVLVSAAQPSNRIAPMIAPCIGPHMRAQAIGGPECRMRRARMLGIDSPASPDSREHRLGREIGAIGRAVCRLDAGSLTRRASARPAARSPPAGGAHSICVDRAAGLRDGVARRRRGRR